MYFVLKIRKILFTLFSSTCVGHHCAHQELLSCTCSLVPINYKNTCLQICLFKVITMYGTKNLKQYPVLMVHLFGNDRVSPVVCKFISGQISLCNMTSLISFINFFWAFSDSTGISNTCRPHWR